MTSSLVGSEMCIRDRVMFSSFSIVNARRSLAPIPMPHIVNACPPRRRQPVSYTHLTLPTICSV
eukprot:2152067-Prorocentrum_lima.AAC.1